MPTSRSHACASVSPLLASRDWKEQRKCIKYEGDPDLQPIKSTENAFLVRLLHQVSSKLNEMVSDSFHILFAKEYFSSLSAQRLFVLAPSVGIKNTCLSEALLPDVECITCQPVFSQHWVEFVSLKMFRYFSWVVFCRGRFTFNTAGLLDLRNTYELARTGIIWNNTEQMAQEVCIKFCVHVLCKM